MNEIPNKIGKYQIHKLIGRGGMGEIFLAYDPTCNRQIALKCIRSDLEITPKIREQFLNEAILTGQLTHPGIIPIYSIVDEKNLVFFTMPYIEGRTLKVLFEEAAQAAVNKDFSNPIYAVSAFIYIFLQICSAVSYAHHKGIIHRDLKPSNILVGQNHDVRILDWGLIKALNEESEETARPTKVSGTIFYFAPELVMGKPPTFQTEIYSLGLILYQMLTLRYPFHRSNISQFEANMEKEVLIDPAKVTPYRDIPPILSKIALKCLENRPENRYQSVDEIIHDLECYFQIQSDWIKIAKLKLENIFDWDFYEKFQFPEMQKGSLYISKKSIVGDLKLEVTISLSEESPGIGFALNVADKENMDLIWFSTGNHTTTKLFHQQKLLMEFPHIMLPLGEQIHIRIEKTENNLYFYFNDIFQGSYMNYLPQIGSHIGFLFSDTSSTISQINVFVKAKNLQGDHLAAADLLLAYKEYDQALIEYRRAAEDHYGTMESREALFRAGVVLLEELRNCKETDKSKSKKMSTLQEFNKLHGLSCAPLEYLGKALIFEWLRDTDNERKTFEYVLQNYPQHPFIGILENQLIYRIQVCNQENSHEFYPLSLLAICHLPFWMVQFLLPILKKKLKPIYFMDDIDISIEKFQRISACVELAFSINESKILVLIIPEAIKQPSHLQLVEGALFGIIELDQGDLAQKKLDELLQLQLDVQAAVHFGWISQLIYANNGNFENIFTSLLTELPRKLQKQHMHFITCLLNQALKWKNISVIHNVVKYFAQYELSKEQQAHLNYYEIWAYLWQKDWKGAEKIFLQFPEGTFNFLHQCWVKAVKKTGDLPILEESSFPWFNREIYQRYALFYFCAEDYDKERYYLDLIERTKMT